MGLSMDELFEIIRKSGPVTKTRVEVGLNMKGVQGTGRLSEMPPGGMCQYYAVI